MIVGTAGHIDHGKTTLVRALTGVDTDRLPEEKKRGISIELGYAFLDAPAGHRIGFVDVPGHERLVHTMLAGATGIDFALLLVAADDGVMPQTLEHLAVLSLLGIARGAVVITKCDRVDTGRLAAVQVEVAHLLQGTSLFGAPVLPVSAPTGQGLTALKALLHDAAARSPRSAARGAAFRLAIDRAFTLDGVGTVVTGTVHAGQVAVGQELRLVPGPLLARVRSVHAQNRVVEQAHAGQRCALALAGVEKAAVARGQWLVAPPVAMQTQRLDARLVLWQAESRPLRSGTAVHVHIGAASVPGTVAVLDPLLIAPGESGLVQVVLQQATGAWHGDRIVLRDACASRTIAGGQVLDPSGPVRYRRTPQRLSELQALSADDADTRLQGLLAVAPQGVELKRFAAAQGGMAAVRPGNVLRGTDAHADWAWSQPLADAGRVRVLQVLAAFHEGHPDELGPDAARLRRLALPRLADPLWRALLAGLQDDARVSLRGAFVHLPEHGVRLSATEQRVAEKVGPRLVEAGFDGAWVRDLAEVSGEPEAVVRVTLARLAQRGELFQVVKDLYYLPETMLRLGAIARELAAGEGGEVTAALFRDATGLGRKRAIQILEHLDRLGLLRRIGDRHRLRADSALFLQEG